VLSLHEADRANMSSTGIIFPYGSNSQCSVGLIMSCEECHVVPHFDVSNYKFWYLGSIGFESWPINQKTCLRFLWLSLVLGRSWNHHKMRPWVHISVPFLIIHNHLILQHPSTHYYVIS